MPDISMCQNESCKHKSICYRYTAIPNEYWQTYTTFMYERDDCLIPIGKKVTNKKILTN